MYCTMGLLDLHFVFEEVKDCEALLRIVLHYNIFILTVIKQTLWCQVITVYIGHLF